MATSLITMLNRLPIYNRPKEPAIGLVIGNPVLIGTTNPNLPTIPIPPKYDHFGNLISISTGVPVTTPPPLISSRGAILGGSSGKQLPPLPPRDVGPQSTGSVHAPAQNQYAPSPSPSLKGTISRKPAPGGSVNTPPPTEAHPAYRPVSPGFNPWGDPQRNLVSAENHGLQTGGRVAPPAMPSPPHHYDNGRPKLVEHRSIDDWMNKRGNAPVPPSKAYGPPQPPPHRFPPRTASVEPPQLNLKLDFEPLEALHHSGHIGSSSRIPMPKDASSSPISKKYTSSPTDDILRSLSESISGLRTKGSTPAPPPEQAGPKDHISELEERRDKLIARRVAIRKDIWALEQALDPTGSNPLSQTHLKRGDIKEMIVKKNVEVDEVEKEIFDVGMLIHRAWKRRCKDGEEGSTHLWIHNVVARTSKE